jgi:hypothetical protein
VDGEAAVQSQVAAARAYQTIEKYASPTAEQREEVDLALGPIALCTLTLTCQLVTHEWIF